MGLVYKFTHWRPAAAAVRQHGPPCIQWEFLLWARENADIRLFAGRAAGRLLSGLEYALLPLGRVAMLRGCHCFI